MCTTTNLTYQDKPIKLTSVFYFALLHPGVTRFRLHAQDSCSLNLVHECYEANRVGLTHSYFFLNELFILIVRNAVIGKPVSINFQSHWLRIGYFHMILGRPIGSTSLR